MGIRERQKVKRKGKPIAGVHTPQWQKDISEGKETSKKPKKWPARFWRR